jgi:hypothetical protein
MDTEQCLDSNMIENQIRSWTRPTGHMRATRAGAAVRAQCAKEKWQRSGESFGGGRLADGACSGGGRWRRETGGPRRRQGRAHAAVDWRMAPASGESAGGGRLAAGDWRTAAAALPNPIAPVGIASRERNKRSMERITFHFFLFC